MLFTKAVRRKAKLRLALTAPSGAGKTLGALMIAKGLGGSIAVADTEHESASLYSSPVRLSGGGLWVPPEFDTLNFAPPYSPERFIETISAAEAGGYATLILDSVTPEWAGVGGCLELVDEIARAKYKGNTWSAWNDVTPRHRAFLDRILRSDLHIIATMRSKTETAQTEDNGKKKVVKLGMKAEQRDGTEYEFTTVLDIAKDGHYATATTTGKDRTGLFCGDPVVISEDTGRRLLEWLESGEDYPPPPRSGLSDNTVADYLALISEADTVDALKKNYEAAYGAARAAADKAAADKFTNAKDARKAVLAKAA